MSRISKPSPGCSAACLLLALALSPVAAGQVVSGQVVATGLASMEAVRVELQALPTPHERVRILVPDAEETPPLSVVRPRSDGRFSLQAPGPGMYRVVVRAAGRMPMLRDLTPLLGDVELPAVELPVERGVPVRVVAPDGTAIGGAALALRQGHGDVWLPERRRGWQPLRRTVSAGADGHAVVPIAEGEERLLIGGGAPGWWGATVAGVPGEELELVLQPGVERRIEVRREGRPAARAALWVTGPARQAVLADEAGVGLVTLPDGEPAEIWVETVDGWRGRYGVRVEAPAEEAAPLPPLRLVLQPPSRLAGRVVGAEGGEPVAGALVWLRSEEGSAVIAAADGRFVYPVAGSEAVDLWAAAAGFERQHLTLELDEWPRAGDGLVLPLPPHGVVAGTVLDPAGSPVPGATVLLRRHRSREASWDPADPGVEAVEVDDEGRFRFADLPRQGSLRLRAAAPGRPPSELEARVGDAEVRLVLGHGGSLRARVRSSDGGAIAGASANLFAMRPGGAVAHYDHGVRLGGLPAELAEDGALRLERVPAGTYELVVELPGHRPLTARGIEVAEGAETDLGTLELEPEAVLEGRVVDLEGRPVAGATLEVEQLEPFSGSTRGHRGRLVEADEAGRFRVGGLSDGRPLDLGIRAEGYFGTWLRDLQLPLGEPLEVRLGRGGIVFGQVVDEAGRPLAGESLVARLAQDVPIPHRMASGQEIATGTSDEDGRFELTAVPVGLVTIGATSRVETVRQDTPVTMIREGERVGPLRIEVPASAEIAGRVLRADGSPAIGAEVAVVREAQRSSFRTSGPPADALGRFRIWGVEPGPVRVVATLGVDGRAEKELIVAGGVQEIELVLAPTTAVAGRVLAADGAPVARGTVRLVRDGGDLHLPVDQLGRFEVVGLDEGTYHLVAEVSGIGRGAHPEPVEVRRGRPVEGLVVRLGAGARVTGRLVGLAEEDLAHVEMMAWAEGGGSASPGLVRPDGSFEIRGLGPGRHSLQAVVRSTGQVERSSFEVEEGARLDGLEIDFSGVTLTVTASVLGQPLDERPWLDGAGVGGTIGARRLGPGRFAFAGLEPGRYRLSILASAAGPRLFRDVEVAGDQEVALDFEAWPVAGSALDEAGEPVPGVVVWVAEPGEELPSRRSWSHGLPADAAGRFDLPAVPPGTWRVVAGGGPWQGEALVEVPPGGTAGVALTLRRRVPDAASTAATSPR
jgi:hypothetical protein